MSARIRCAPLLALAAWTFFASSAAGAGQAFRFVVLADLHIGKNDAQFVPAYDQAIREITEARNKPAAVFAIGDITDHGQEAEFANFNAWIVEPLKQAGIPIYAAAGAREAEPAGSWTNQVGPLFQAVTVQQTRFILAAPSPGATIESNQLAWIGRELESPDATNAELRVLLTHYPLWKDDFGETELRDADSGGVRTGAGSALREWAGKGRLDLVLCGYHHFQAAPIQHETTGPRPAWHVLVESSVLGRSYKVNDKGRPRTFSGFGYSVFDVSGSAVTHHRKVLDTSGFATLGEVNTFTTAAPAP